MNAKHFKISRKKKRMQSEDFLANPTSTLSRSEAQGQNKLPSQLINLRKDANSITLRNRRTLEEFEKNRSKEKKCRGEFYN